MKYIRPVFVLLLLLSLPAISSANWQSEKGLKVAVMEIVSRVESESIDAATITDMLQARFVEKKKFTILERAMLNKIIEEKKLYLMGLTDTDASKVGAMAGADKIITGSLARMGDRYVILLKGIDTGSGVVEVSAQELISSIRDLPEAVRTIADRVMDKASGERVEADLHPDRREAVVLDERLESNQNRWSAWMAGDEFGKEMDKQWRNGYYPASVEGRSHDERSEFRAVLQPFPKKVWWFYWWYDQLGGSYDEHRKKMIAEGFKEINLQVFTDKAGMKKYQTGWIKYGSTNPDQATAGHTEKFIINANAGWQNTVTVAEGKTVTIKASGQWNHGEEKYGSYGPQGCGKMDNGAPLPDACIGTLIGRINNGPPFAIGPERTFTLSSSGILQISMNDWGFEGNTGSMNVLVEVK